MSFYDDLKKVLITFFGLLADAAKVSGEYITHYFQFLKRMVKLYLLWIVALPLVVVLPALLLQKPWTGLYSGYAALVGLGAVCLTALAFPLLFAVELIFDKIPKFKENIYRTTRHIADVGFWAAMLAIYFYIVPIWKNPSALPLVILTVIALALAVATGRVTVNPRLVQIIRTVQLFSLLFFSVLAFSLPKTAQMILTLDIDEKVPELPWIAEPKAIDVTSAANIEFVNRKSGRSLVWYYLSPDGRYELYDAKGYHPSGTALRPAYTEQEKAAITAYFRGRELAQQEAEHRQSVDEAVAKRFADEAAKKLQAEAEAKRLVDQAANKAQAEADAKQLAEEKRLADEKARIEAEAKAKVEAVEREDARLQALVETKRIGEEKRLAKQAKYLMPVERKEGITQPRIAVVATSQNEPDTALTEAVNLMANRSGFVPVNHLFKNEFLSDGLFDTAFNRGFVPLNELDLTNHCEFLVLCLFTTSVESPASQAKAIDGKLRIKLFRCGTGALLSSQEYEASAIRFDPAKAIAPIRDQFVALLATNSLPQPSKIK